MDSEQEMNAGVKVVCAVLLVAVVTAAGVGLLIQNRKLDKLRFERASLENVNQQLATNRIALVSANEKLEDELRKLREVGRARAAEWAAAEKERTALKAERTAWKAEKESLAGRAAKASGELKSARAAQSRAEKVVAGLKAQIKDLSAANEKIRSEREDLRAKRDQLERELGEALQPAQEADNPPPEPAPVPNAEESAISIPLAPPPDKRTPEEREAIRKKELDALDNL